MAPTKRGVKPTKPTTLPAMRAKRVVIKNTKGLNGAAANDAFAPHDFSTREGQLIVLSDALIRMGLRGEYGRQYEGERDVAAMAGYRKSMSFKDYKALYDRNPVAGSVIDMPAETTWRSPPEIKEVEKAQTLKMRVEQIGNRRVYNRRLKTKGDTAFTKAWQELVDRLGVWERLERVDRNARLGEYAVLLLGTTDVVLDSDWSKPLASFSDDPTQLVYLQGYDQGRVSISKWDESPKSERFGQPEIYTIQFARSGQKGFGARSGAVHWSRVIHVAEDLTNDDVYGRPVLERLFDSFTDLLKVTSSTGEAFWQHVAGVLQAVIENSKDSRPLTDPELEAMDQDLQDIYHNLRRTFLGQGVKLERLASEMMDPTPSVTMYMRLISSGVRIPMRMLFGSETGERSSTEDAKTYFGSIEERQVHYAEPRILRPFINRLLTHGLLPKHGAAGYEAVWPELAVESALDNANANLSRAKAIQALTAAGDDPLKLAEIDEERNIWPVPSTPNDPARELVDPPDPALDAGAPLEDDEDDPNAEDDARITGGR